MINTINNQLMLCFLQRIRRGLAVINKIHWCATVCVINGRRRLVL